jgi:GNAT superfamily N-acetyltransferase
MISTHLRRATPADAETLSALGERTFADTFGHLYPPEDLADFMQNHAPTLYAGWAADPACLLLIAEREGSAIGYALSGPCSLPHAEVTPGCGELKRIYVDKAAQGAGAGSLLLNASLDWLQTPGRTLWIGVWSENHGAQRLYGRHGFSQAGTYEFPVGKTRDHEFILRRRAEEIPTAP